MLEWPKWKTDLDAFQNYKNAFIIEGNVHDQQVWINEDIDSCSIISLNQFFDMYLKKLGYDIVIFYNRVDGFHNPFSVDDIQEFAKIVPSYAEFEKNCKHNNDNQESSDKNMLNASVMMREAIQNTMKTVAIIFDLANVAVSSVSMLTDYESEMMARLLLTSKTTYQNTSAVNSRVLNNTIYYVVEKANDLPAWLYLNNPFIKTITITKIEKELRKSIIRVRKSCFANADSLSFDEQEKAFETLANLTEGFSTADLYSFCKMCKEKQFLLNNGKKAIDYFKFGIVESHWDKIGPDKIKNIEHDLKQRVKGQDEVIRKSSEIICRASLGLTGIQKGSGTRPKGVLFFAGPTGTGKTELAKSIAEFVFGDENFITRFDMSEYQQPQSDQKLLGAPPGYVGYGAGGQLTNAVKEKPFNILLFDEIDKAHPSILDKFLQILDDGRMTDSFGETVYFSESLIVFTSNLGMTKEDGLGNRIANVTIDEDYETVKRKINAAIKEYFVNIGRPEILNRIGSNIVVFNFIKDEKIIKDIVELQLDKVKKNLYEEKGIELDFSDEYFESLLNLVQVNTENGARGISNKVEEHLVNLLPYVFINNEINKGCIINIKGFDEQHHLIVEISKKDENAQSTQSIGE